MAKYLGRKVILERGSVPVANIRTKSLSINRELVDTSDDDSGAWATHLDEPGQIDVTMSVEGVIADYGIMDEALNPVSGNQTYTLKYPDGSSISAEFGLSSFELSDTYNEVSTYSFELRATGEVTRTVPAP